jgi:hypothetical protein
LTIERIASSRQSRNIFVAYPYSIPAADYRRPFTELSESFGVKFIFADEQITNRHILDKITEYIRDSRFSLFDITNWNPNVTLELGIAIGHRAAYYLLFNPTLAQQTVPADLGGIDRIQYASFKELADGLTRLLLQEFGVPQAGKEMADQLAVLQQRVPEILRLEPGLGVSAIAARLGVATEMAKIVVRPLANAGELQTTGVRRGTRYWLPEQEGTRPARRPAP